MDQEGQYKLIQAYHLTGQSNLYLVHFKQPEKSNDILLVYGSYDVDDGNMNTSSSLSGDHLIITKTYYGENSKEVISVENYRLSSNGFELISDQGAEH